MNLTIQDHRAAATLNVKMRYQEGVMTRREWIALKKREGAEVYEKTKPLIEFNRTKFNRMASYKEQEEYEKKCETMIPGWRLREGGQTSNYEITKAEYDYFNTL